MPTIPDYRARLDRAERVHAITDEPGLVDADPEQDRVIAAKRHERVGTTIAPQRAARASLAQVVREIADPRELVEMLLAIARVDPDSMVKIAAIKTLCDRGWGRPAQIHQVETSVTVNTATAAEMEALRAMSDADLRAAVDLAARLKERLAAPRSVH
jgi:hypothetical protein